MNFLKWNSPKIDNLKANYILNASIIFIFLGGVTVFIRFLFQNIDLSSAPDLFWAASAGFLMVGLFQKNNIYMYLPIILLGIATELFQKYNSIEGTFFWGYYPGTYDINDIYAYIIGTFIAIIGVLIIINKEKLFNIFK
jgi:hypothetical protein